MCGVRASAENRKKNCAEMAVRWSSRTRQSLKFIGKLSNVRLFLDFTCICFAGVHISIIGLNLGYDRQLYYILVEGVLVNC